MQRKRPLLQRPKFRAAFVVFSHNLLNVLILFEVANMTAEQLAALMLVISSGITLAMYASNGHE